MGSEVLEEIDNFIGFRSPDGNIGQDIDCCIPDLLVLAVLDGPGQFFDIIGRWIFLDGYEVINGGTFRLDRRGAGIP